MKLWIAIFLMLAFLAGSAVVLLRTDQAPLPLAAEPAAPPAPAPTAPLVPEKKVLTTEEFRALGAEVMEALPNIDSFHKGQDLPILEAGAQFARLNEAVGEDGGLRAEAMTLYQECANSGQYQDGVRALCYWNLRALAKKAGKQLSRRSAPAHIRELAERL